jgi:hypothetical protein
MNPGQAPYEQWIAQGWTDEQLIAANIATHNYLEPTP